MRISDWSSDVCSSDLHHLAAAANAIAPGVAFAGVGEAVGGIGRRKVILHLRIGAAARHIEERAAARRVTGAQPGARLILAAAGPHIAATAGRNARPAVLGFAAAAFDPRSDDAITPVAIPGDQSQIYRTASQP